MKDWILNNADYFLRIGGDRAEKTALSFITAIRVIMWQNSYKKHKGNEELINLDWKIYFKNFVDKCDKEFEKLLEMKDNELL